MSTTGDIHPISPWSNSVDRVSPDGRYRAEIMDAIEIGMGAPTSGTLIVSENRYGGAVLVHLHACNPSLVWSADSRALAIPQWTAQRQQTLCIVSLPSGIVRSVPGEFRVLELHSFEDGILRGIDSPVYQPRSVEIAVHD